jgi:hypothetical protein
MTHSRMLFGCAIFLASFLLFLVEPMAAKQLLPIFGGSAAVWITCLVFFQTALLFAYLYAHWLTHTGDQRPDRAPTNFGLILFSILSSIAFATEGIEFGHASANPMLSILVTLGLSVGLPFLALGSASPLFQVWWSRIEAGPIPYRLFALSNLASLLALGLYPSLIEPYFTLRTQRLGWTCGFIVFALLFAYLTGKVRSVPSRRVESVTSQESQAPASSLRHKLLWLLLPMAASMQLSAVTSHLTENIAAIPLLWILPLAVYLITLILAFQFPRLLPQGILTRLLVVMLAGLGYMLTKPDGSLPLRISILFFLLELFLAGLFCHSEAYALRPARSSETTLFYLLFAAGGALGSFLIGIASPLLSSFNYDLEISFCATSILALAVLWPTGWGQRLVWTSSSILMLALVFLLHNAYRRNTPVAVRNFYGGLRVKQTVGYPGAVTRTLSNGTIQHGTQIFSDALRKTPTTYYAEDSGIGLAMHWCCESRLKGTGRNIGVVGLGAGTLAAYGKPGDRITFYEINPAVEPIARNLFTYIRDSGAQISVVNGDARASLVQQAPQKFDVLVIDAFSGDAIPLHLLTTQALELYKQNLTPNGILAFHISNQHVDLEPEVALLAKAAGMQAMRVSTPANEDRGEFTATWMLLTNSPTFFSIPEVFNQAKKPSEDPRVRVWTDDYSSLLPVLRW